MKKKTYIVTAATAFVLLFSITSWAYWKDELKVKSTIPVVYNVEVEIKEEAESKENDIIIKSQREDANAENPEESVGEKTEAESEENIERIGTESENE